MGLDVHPQLLRALRTVVETGSLTAASERLGFTQSALSKQIAALEAAAGVPLLHRRPRGVEATEAGRRLTAHAVTVLDQLDAAQRELRALGTPLDGEVAVGAFPTAGMHLVPSVIARVRIDHPGVRVDLVESSTPVQLRRLRAGTLDLAILSAGDGLAEWDSSGLDLDPLPSGPLLVVVGARHRLAGAGRVGVAELASEEWIVGRGARGDPQFGAWPTLREPRVGAELTGWTTRLGFVASGLGVTTAPSLMAAALPRDVVALEVDDPHFQGRSMLLASVGPLNPAVATVQRAVRAESARIATPAPGPG